MSPLPDQRLERLARTLAKGGTPFAALAEAGFEGSRAEAGEVAKIPQIAARVAELQAVMAQETVTTPNEQFGALEAARQLAMTRRDPSSAISAIMEKAQLLDSVGTDCLKGAPREPMTHRELAVRYAKFIRRHGFELRHFTKSARKLEAMVNQLLANETDLADDVTRDSPIVPSTNNRIPTLIQLLNELEQARQLAMMIGKTGVATRAIKARGKLQERLTREATEREKADDKRYMTGIQLERYILFVLNMGIEEPDKIC